MDLEPGQACFGPHSARRIVIEVTDDEVTYLLPISTTVETLPRADFEAWVVP
jgi:hypothetical protein